MRWADTFGRIVTLSATCTHTHTHTHPFNDTQKLEELLISTEVDEVGWTIVILSFF
jgi:hypothetical protein